LAIAMPKKPTAEDLISLFEQLIKLVGVDSLGHTEWTQFYSGPRTEILAELFGRTAKKLTAAHKNKSNHKKSERETTLIPRFSSLIHPLFTCLL
jgi:hypothetical protein